ncbi:hypothetical protein [uncultured Shewanella sp.]|uniref:hypothetical protein n=1 Tax=uncultured Shewanella sp. TaxID=173975 RepID=UPI00261C4E1B|nr:hypothetical protein [uncultured Shewanella sp.]
MPNFKQLDTIKEKKLADLKMHQLNHILCRYNDYIKGVKFNGYTISIGNIIEFHFNQPKDLTIKQQKKVQELIDRAISDGFNNENRAISAPAIELSQKNKQITL